MVLVALCSTTKRGHAKAGACSVCAQLLCVDTIRNKLASGVATRVMHFVGKSKRMRKQDRGLRRRVSTWRILSPRSSVVSPTAVLVSGSRLDIEADAETKRSPQCTVSPVNITGPPPAMFAAVAPSGHRADVPDATGPGDAFNASGARPDDGAVTRANAPVPAPRRGDLVAHELQLTDVGDELEVERGVPAATVPSPKLQVHD